MDEIKKLYGGTLTDTETEIYSGNAIIKSIVLCNPTTTNVDITLKLDDVIIFSNLEIAAGDTKIFDNVLVTSSIKAKGDGLNAYISGIECI